MAKVIAYKRPGKFGKDEFLVPMSCLQIIRKKETEKAYCCGEYTGYTYKDGNPQVHIFGWIPKSQLVDINGEKFVPTWIIDKWNYTHLQYTDWIISDWRKEKWDVREMPTQTTLSPICSTDPEDDWEDEWPDADEGVHDDIWWKNKFAEEERKQEEAAFMAKMEYEMAYTGRWI